MRNLLLYSGIFASMIFSGCAAMNDTRHTGASASEDFKDSRSCIGCHPKQYDAWAKSPHANAKRMSTVEDVRLQGCAACHDQSTAHAENPEKVIPRSISGMSKTEQNSLCGACHYNTTVVRGNSVNPRNRHGVFMSVGLEGYKRQFSCLDCHTGHGGKADMLRSVRAHTCFGCHKEAVITMGVFQPINYLTAGKTCVSCHPSHGGSRPHQVARMTVGMAVTCIVCHPTGDLHKTGF